jgi:multiple sugar transport system ATP-binding protein
MNFVDAKVQQGTLVTNQFTLQLSEAEKKALAAYEGKEIVLGFRPENTRVGNDFEMKVLSNENLGMNTLVHGHIGADGKGTRITCKLNGWCNYKPGDVVGISVVRRHFFDKETTNAIRMEE